MYHKSIFVSKKNFNFLDWLKLSENYNFPFRQIKFQAMNFTKSMKNASKIRLEIFKLKTKHEIKDFFEKLYIN